MKVSSTSIFLLASNVIAAPTLDVKRSIPGPVRFIDTAIQVENLQVALLTQGLKAFTEAQFQKAGFSGKNFYRNLKEIVVDSRNHIATAAKVEQGKINIKQLPTLAKLANLHISYSGI